MRSEIRQKYGINDSTYVYGFIGRISKDKGNNELIEAFRTIDPEHDVALLLIGPDEGSLEKDIIRWAQKCPKVFFMGRIDHEDIPQYLASMDVLVHPTYREGFGMVLQEAMAMEVPIITTDIPGPSEVIEAGVSGILVPSHDAKALADAMLDFYINQDKYVQYGKNGRKRVETYFNRPKMIHEIYVDKEELYNEYINHKEQ